MTRKPHNDYVEIISRYGLVGAILWTGLFASLLLPIWRAATSRTHSEKERAFLVWVIAAAFGYMFIAGTQPLLAFPYGTLPLFMLLGMGLAQARRGTSLGAEAADD
jgi:O-antigen ligase